MSALFQQTVQCTSPKPHLKFGPKVTSSKFSQCAKLPKGEDGSSRLNRTVQLQLNIADGGLYEGEQSRGEEDEEDEGGVEAGAGVGCFGVMIVVLLLGMAVA